MLFGNSPSVNTPTVPTGALSARSPDAGQESRVGVEAASPGEWAPGWAFPEPECCFPHL